MNGSRPAFILNDAHRGVLNYADIVQEQCAFRMSGITGIMAGILLLGEKYKRNNGRTDDKILQNCFIQFRVKRAWPTLKKREREREREREGEEKNDIPSRAPRLVYRYHVETIYINGKLIKLHVLHALLLIIELVQRVADITACYYLCMQHSIFDNEKQNLQQHVVI